MIPNCPLTVERQYQAALEDFCPGVWYKTEGKTERAEACNECQYSRVKVFKMESRKIQKGEKNGTDGIDD
jgi:hypothetical protein